MNDTTHAPHAGSIKNQHSNFNRFLSILTAQFDSFMMFLQVML
ncbi:MAG: hypothetical protein NTW85_08315 [Methylococcales bacterium]|nr:hypothetical protein [Methylococcales bacterium]